MNAIVLQKAIDVTAPAGGNRGRAKCVFQDQIPSNDPGKNLAQSRIAIRVGRSGNRNQRGEFRIAESRECASDARKDKGKHRSEERRVGKECRSRWSPY